MVSIIASLAGFISSLLPMILQIIRDRQDKKHELMVFDRQLEMQKLRGNQHLTELGADFDYKQLEFVYQPTYSMRIRLVEALNGMVRPLMAYGFFLLYCIIKFINLRYVVETNNYELIHSFWWNEEGQAIFASILSFYFGNRAVNKFYHTVR